MSNCSNEFNSKTSNPKISKIPFGNKDKERKRHTHTHTHTQERITRQTQNDRNETTFPLNPSHPILHFKSYEVSL